MEKNRVHYEYYHLGMTENVPEFEGFHFHTLRHPYVKPTTKKFITFFEVFRAAS